MGYSLLNSSSGSAQCSNCDLNITKMNAFLGALILVLNEITGFLVIHALKVKKEEVLKIDLNPNNYD